VVTRSIQLASLEAAQKNLRKMTKTRNRVGVVEIAEVAEIVVDAASDQSATVHVPLSLQSPKPTPNLLSAVGAKNAMAVH
jgi:predicted dinucleotide-utilizing enzyme